RGPEKRRAIRVPFGVPVLCRLDGSRSDAILAELSTGGCRLLTPEQAAPGASVALTVPPEADGEDPLALPGRVLRVHRENGESSIAVAFEPLDADREAALARTLLRRAVAPSVADDERRSHPRRPFEETVTELNREAGRALVGRDVSLGGMRIDAHPELKVGDELQLAIYGSAEGAPAVVQAVVVRDDGPEGLGLRFENVNAEVAGQLESLVTTLPSIEPLACGEAAAMGAVLSRILPEAE
ncbi:MAG: PilZ domain-containing protein, partial [Myxococcales bacterium]|nr:PilZ domain-containing protein [Myxococcales bacterium]